ncbi:MAG: hypothetical protein KDK36_19780 [Leptospiraceae bacterium]|nr:hypothetical protein [Leptospiraceae bacterium]
MKSLLVLILSILFSCNFQENKIPGYDKNIRITDGVTYYKDMPYSGKIEYDFHASKKIENYNNGILDGEQLIIHESGILLGLYPYKQGKKVGEHKEWHPNGKYQSYGKYANGIPVGEFWRWHANGEVETLQKFDENGELLFTKRWRPTGQIYFNLAKVNDKYVGLKGSSLCDPSETSKVEKK